jgi:hypothetical protein
MTDYASSEADRPQSGQRRSLILGSVGLALAASLRSGANAAERPKPQPADWADPQFQEPYIDIDEWRDNPVRHRYIHGGFKATDARFSLYFAPKERYQGRFFHHVMHISGNENNAQLFTGADSAIGFSVASGGYFVESNLGRLDAAAGNDGTLTGWRTSAAVAKYARSLAVGMYGPHRRPFGYLFGGSGGGYKTMSAMENTVGIWDGAVPYIIGSPMALPNVYTVRMHAMRILGDKISTVVDAVDPGGSGDMYAGLNQEQREALREATRFGFSPRTWAFHETLGMNTAGAISSADPTYANDFWTVPGYLGANPPESLVRDRIQHTTKISKILVNDEVDKLSPLPVPPTVTPRDRPPVRVGLQLDSMPKGYILGAKLTMKSGSSAGRALSANSAVGDVIVATVASNAESIFNGIKAGDEVEIDNSQNLAGQTFHRHQVPSRDYHVWDQFRGSDGNPLYPQRPRLLGPITAEQGAGSVQSGRFAGKLIVVSMLMDEAALAWNADWYRTRVREVMGSRFDDNFRLWYVDHALHGAGANGKHNTRIINYTGVLQQALRDVSAWVEKGTTPPVGTDYRLVDGQIEVPATAAARGGVQPVVTLTVNGGVRADVGVGTPVTFSGMVEVPPNTGKVVSAEWDFEGTGDYPVQGVVKHSDGSGAHATVATTYAFSKPGTYFPALRAASQRRPDGTLYARAQNLARVRVVVT